MIISDIISIINSIVQIVCRIYDSKNKSQK